jgi:hypothetical protein
MIDLAIRLDGRRHSAKLADIDRRRARNVATVEQDERTTP